ncbi:hypothetical protein ACHAWU_009144 [Discostella pseudostelligera]|uniref:Ubiquitin-like domain-containing protein n=1 Tax=Discostella pseudostelligera TaxID=259834 RepID=A0ABD3N3L7_9STRA
MEQKPPLSYASRVLDAAGFKFQLRKHFDGDTRRRLDIKRFSNLDFDGVIRDGKAELVLSLIEDVVWCEVNESDLKLYGDVTVVKFIQVAQLIIEYLIHAKDTLTLNLNALAKKYSAKKREIQTLSKSPHHQQTASPGSRASWPPVISSRSPSLSQECHPLKSTHGSNEDTSKPEPTLSNESFHLHIVSSTNALYLRMNVENSITVQNLKNKLIGRLLLADGTCDTNFDLHSLYFKDIELKDSTRTLNNYQVGNGAALVFMPRRLSGDENEKLRHASITDTSRIETKLEKLTSIATASYEELVLATRAFQFQLSMQEASKEAFLYDVGKQIREALHSQVQQAVVVEDRSKHVDVEASTSSREKPLTFDEVKETNQEDLKQGDALSTNEHSQESAGDDDECRGASDVPLRVDTSAEGFNVVVSPFHPPSEIVSPFKLPCEMEARQENATFDAVVETKTPTSMNRPVNADLEIEFSMNSLNSMLDDIDEVIDKRTVTPTKGYLLYHGNDDHIDDAAHSPSTASGGAITPSKRKENDLWTSDELLNDGNDSEGITEIIDHCSSTVLQISSRRTTTSEFDDMQSVAISQSEPEIPSIHHAEVNVKKSKQGGKKKGHFHLLKKATKGLLLSKK